MYDVPGLTKLSASKFEAEAETCSLPDAEELIDLARAVYQITEHDADGLLLAFWHMIARHHRTIVKDKIFKKAIIENAGFAAEFMERQYTFKEMELSEQQERNTQVVGKLESARVTDSEKHEAEITDSRVAKDELETTVRTRDEELAALTKELEEAKSAATQSSEKIAKLADDLSLKVFLFEEITTALLKEKSEVATLKTAKKSLEDAHVKDEKTLLETLSLADDIKFLKLSLKEKEAALLKAESELATEKTNHKRSRGALNSAVSYESRISARNTELEDELEEAQARATDLEAHVEIRNAVIYQLVGLNKIRQCRHCDAPSFLYRLQRNGPNGYIARCVYCNTRHWHGAEI